MNWLFELYETQPVAHAIGILSFVCVAGMAVGSIRMRGVGLGTAGVLFAGIFAGHFGSPIDHHTLEFVKELDSSFSSSRLVCNLALVFLQRCVSKA